MKVVRPCFKASFVVGAVVALMARVDAAPPPIGGTVRLAGHVPEIVAAAEPMSTASAQPAEKLSLTVVLRREDAAGFERYLRDVYDPASRVYRRFASASTLADRFGPSRRTYGRVAEYFRAAGFEVVGRSKSRLTLSVRAPRAVVARVLQTPIEDFRIGARTFHANVEDPALPRRLALHVQSITGLSNAAEVHASKKAIRFALYAIPCALVLYPIRPPFGTKICTPPEHVGDPTGINPYKLCISAVRAAVESDTEFNFDFLQYTWLYDQSHVVNLIEPCPPGTQPQGIGATAGAPAARPRASSARAAITGAGQKIGIIAFDSFVQSDVADYLALMGIPASRLAQLRAVHVNGGAPLGADQDEVLLDVTTAMTLAAEAEVTVYDAPFTGAGSFQALFNAAIDDGATVISNSFAYCEDQTSRADVESLDAIFATAAAAGVSVFNASGDTGSTCLDGSPNTVAVPAGAPHATAVGGSSVTSGGGQARVTETWWDGSASTPPTGQGGFGVSRFFTRPAYQDGDTTAAMRSVPDVVSNADPARGVMICQASAGGCPTGALYGGTSVSAPRWAAFTALVNQALGRNLGSVNETLYPLAGSLAFHDAAALGSDFAHVGLGSPSVDHIIRLLNGQEMGVPDAARSIVSPALQTAYVGDLETSAAVPADGTSKGYVAVRLIDGNGHLVVGKTVTLAGSPGNHVVITPPSGVTDTHGQVVFSVTNLTAEEVTFTATDTTDGVVPVAQPTIVFSVPPATAAGISASGSPVTADGVAFATVSVTLQDVLGRPTPGKEIVLSQGGGHSLVTAPSPSVTDANGRIDFQVRNFANETVTYSAVDVTDGELPVPGTAQVAFQNAVGTPCGLETPVGANGYTLTPFITGFDARIFTYGNVNWGGCPGASVAAFDPTGVFVAGFTDGAFHQVPPGGGAVTTANKLSTLGPTLSWPVFGKNRKLYAVRANTGTNEFSGKVVELDATTGAELRTLAENLPCASGLAVDPLSGDLFFDNQCFGGPEDALVRRIRSPESATPTVETYATLPAPVSGILSFTPNGTLYAATNYTGTRAVVRISGTDTATPGTVTPVTGLQSVFWLTVAETLPNGDAKSFVVLAPTAPNPLQLVDITTTPFTTTDLTSAGMGSGTIGPDGCLYPPLAGTLYRLTDPTGGCTFAATTANPSISLTPARVTEAPARGTPHTVTASLRNVAGASGTPVFFEITGANPRLAKVRADANGRAVFTYTGAQEGADVITARATVEPAGVLLSNRARLTWGPGKQSTTVSLNLSPTATTPGVATNLVATLAALGLDAPTPVAGATVSFTLGTAQCSAVTDAAGRATCPVTPAALGRLALGAAFAGNDTLLPASDSVAFAVTCPGDLDGVACHLAVYQAAVDGAAQDQLKAKFKRSLSKKGKRLTALVAKSKQAGRKGKVAQKKLTRGLAGLKKRLTRLRTRKIPAPFADGLIGSVTNAQGALPLPHSTRVTKPSDSPVSVSSMLTCASV